MSLKVHPDPQHPAGGHGFLEVPGGSLPNGPVSVAVQDAYSGRWLHPAEGTEDGENWRPQRHAFGPFQVHRQEHGDRILIGPEIVNRIGEYTPLRIELNDHAHDVTWPDTMLPAAPRAEPGRLSATARPVAIAAPVAPVAPVVPPVRPDIPKPQPEMETAEPPASRRWLLILLLVLAVAAVAAFFWFNRDGGGSGTTATGDPDLCSAERVLSLDGYTPRIAAVRDCGRSALPETALRVVEDAAAANNSEALLLFGTLYDDKHLDARIENLVGLTFSDNPARAAEYYARAARAGSQEAADRLATVCNDLAGSKLTLDASAFDDFCN